MTQDLDELIASNDWHSQSVVEVDEPLQSLVIVRLGSQIVALPGAQVRETVPLTDIFFVPGCPADMPGVINLRGDILSIIRLRQQLAAHGFGQGQDPTSPELASRDSGMILVVKGQAMTTGLLVDEVLDLIELPDSALKPPLATLPTQLLPLVVATLDWNQEAVTCLNAEALLTEYHARLNVRSNVL